MNYEKIYDNLIARAASRVTEGYVEKHHIVPRCLGGTNAKENIANLYPEEHYLAHLLLVKIYPSNHKLIRAAHMMTVNSNTTRRSNKSFGWLRRQNAIAMSEQMKAYQLEFGHPRGMLGKTNTKKSNEARSLAMTGRPSPVKGRKNPGVSQARKGKSLPKLVCRLSDQKELDLANFAAYCKRLGDPVTASDANTRRANAQKGKSKPQPTVMCPHCNKTGGKNVMQRHHFDKCKLKDVI
jgi:hypothetical protein